MRGWRGMMVLVAVALVIGAVPAAAAPKGGDLKGGGKGGKDPNPDLLMSLCDGWRGSDTYTENGVEMPADLACDEAHGVESAIPWAESQVWPMIFSDCAGMGSFRPGNSHPCPHGSVGLTGLNGIEPGDYAAWFSAFAAGWAGAVTDTVFGHDANVARFSNVAAVVESDLREGRIFPVGLRLYLSTYPSGDKFNTDKDDPDLLLGAGCDWPADRSVTLHWHRNGVRLYPGRGDRAVTRDGPVAEFSIGDIVLVPPDVTDPTHVERIVGPSGVCSGTG